MNIEEIVKLSETDIRNMLINPAIQKKGWLKPENTASEYYFTDGRILVAPNNMCAKKKGKFADYYLFNGSKQQPLTIIEAKAASFNTESDLVKGIQEAIEYGEMLDLGIVYASNGLMFREYDLITCKQRDLEMDQFPTQQELVERIAAERKLTENEQKIIGTPYYFGQFTHEPRYYQRIAINRTVEAIARGQNRVLLVMATGTGKTFTAFQIIWRLREAGLKKKILYLADRNILIDQSMSQDFKPFQKVMTKVQGKTMESSYEIHLALYQQLVGNKEHPENAYEQFKPDYFDLVVVDECHRGSVKDSSAWKDVLRYFDKATHLGLTATPKDAEGASNVEYFGEPIYTYSLRQGIEDGFLAPYKVTKSLINIDLQGFEPTKDDLVKAGNMELKDWYSRKQFGREIVIEMRQKIVAKRIVDKLNEIGSMKKTIVFCADIDEAGRMRDNLIDLCGSMMKKDNRYIMRITSDDAKEKKQLDNFIDPYSPYPTIVTTSELLSTGVDCKTCALIVIDKEIESMTQFKQIIGRGTRIYEFDELDKSKNKYFFDILDFRGATDKFHDPSFDGELSTNGGNNGSSNVEPSPQSPQSPQTPQSPQIPQTPVSPQTPISPREKHIFKGKNIVIQTELVSVIGPDGKTMETAGIYDFTKKNIRSKYATLDDFLISWTEAERKKAIIEELKEYDVILDAVRKSKPELANADDFDVICFVAYGQKPLTRKERVEKVRKRNVFAKYGEQCRKVLESLLDKYSDQGVVNMQDPDTLRLAPFNSIGSPVKIIKLFGGKDKYAEAVQELINELYSA